ncbi:PQQ-dependent sugar dehydrogenase [Amycolatopsis japonica]|uniref:PQQ-dependent sugar dehydrogenase n=1 Tax=Amycolatopsis japonica TaxID=208439 RepID=UPI0037B4FEE4
MRSRRSIAAATAILTALGVTVVTAPVAAAAPVLPAGFVLTDTPTGQPAGDLTDVAYLPDGGVLTTGRHGSVRWTPKGGQPSEIASIPVYTGGSLGLTSIAVAPDYATSRTIYTAQALSNSGDRAFRVSRWQVQGTDAPTGLTHEKPMFQIPANSDNRGIQDLAVDPSGGTLWIAVGDNAADQAPESATKDTVDKFALRALDPGQPTGKILRVDTTTGAGVSGNPFYDMATPDSWRSRNYLSGLRDPRITLDQRGGIVVTDNGWAARDEVNIALPGQNQKWPCWEGTGKTPGYRDLAECGNVLNTAPLTETARQANGDILGGVFYAGTSYPESYRARHFVADKGAGTLSTLRFDSAGKVVDQPAVLASGIGSPAALATAPNGDIVVADASTSTLRRLSYRPANKAPTASFDAAYSSGGRTVWFDASTSMDPDFDDIAYEWDFGDGGTGTGRIVPHVYAPTAEKVTVTLTTRDINGTATTTTQSVTPNIYGPTVIMSSPGLDVRFPAREPITLTAEASDPVEGPLTVNWTAERVVCPNQDSCTTSVLRTGSGPSFWLHYPDDNDGKVVFTASVSNSRGVVNRARYVALPRQARVSISATNEARLDVGRGQGQALDRLVTVGSLVSITAPSEAFDGARFTEWGDNHDPSPQRQFLVPMGGMQVRADYQSPIEKRYAEDASLRAKLGAATGVETIEADLHWQPYANGRLYWTPRTGVTGVSGAIHEKYVALGAHAFLGVPTTDETLGKVGDGRFNHFEGGPATGAGTIYWTPASGAVAIYGPIRDKWLETGAEGGLLGPPTTDQATTPDGTGRYSHFAGSSIYWTAATGAHYIKGEIRNKWRALGWERYFGYPTTDESGTPDGVGKYNHFSQAGSIYWTPSTGAYEVHGLIRARWSAIGWENGVGYPITDETWTPGNTGKYNHFRQGGFDHSIYWRAGTSVAWEVKGMIRLRWRDLGWQTSYLGFPVSGEYRTPTGYRSDFQNGYITYNGSTGAIEDRRY